MKAEAKKWRPLLGGFKGKKHKPWEQSWQGFQNLHILILVTNTGTINFILQQTLSQVVKKHINFVNAFFFPAEKLQYQR